MRLAVLGLENLQSMYREVFHRSFLVLKRFYYTTQFIHMTLLACRLKRNLLARVYIEVLTLL